MCNQKDNAFELTPNDKISLMEIYLTEWTHRDNILWSQVFKFFFSSLITIFLPNVSPYVGIDLPDFPVIIFPWAGLIMSIVFLYVALGYSYRLSAIGKTYLSFIQKLPKNCQRIPLEDLKFGFLFKPKMSFVVSFLLFGVLTVLAIVMIIYYSNL